MSNAESDLIIRLRFEREEQADTPQRRRIYAVEMSCISSFDASAFNPLKDIGANPPTYIAIPPETLLIHQGDWPVYGQLLGTALFGPADIKTAWRRVVDRMENAGGSTLRVRLDLDESDSFLHRLAWETIRIPGQAGWLATDKRIYFSRFLSSGAGGPLSLPARSAQRAVAVVANPTAPNLKAIDVNAEMENLAEGLPDVAIRHLTDPGAATLENIDAALQDGCDIFYLVCHGMVTRETGQVTPFLILEDQDNRPVRIPAEDLVTRIRQLEKSKPLLAILVSCQSSGDGTGDALKALGPRLIDVGVPAVVAMQGNFTMDSHRAFTPTFLRELNLDGRIERALAHARGAIRDRDDVWMPALFSRLVQGRLWAVQRERIVVATDAPAAEKRRTLAHLQQTLARLESRRRELFDERRRLEEAGDFSETTLQRLGELSVSVIQIGKDINAHKEQIATLERALPPAGESDQPLGQLASRVRTLVGDRARLGREDALLWEALITLDCQQQSRAFRRLTAAQRSSVILLQGDSQFHIHYGLQQLLHRLYRELYRLDPAEIDPVPLQPAVHAAFDAQAAWDLVADALELEGVTGGQRKKRVAEALAAKLRHRHVVFTVARAQGIGDLLDVTEHFWQPLVEAVNRPVPSGQLLMLILDNTARFADAPPHPALRKLDPVTRYPRDQFDLWYDNQEDDLPAPLRRLQLTDLDRLWQNSENGVSDLLLNELCKPVQIPLENLFT